MDWEMLGGASTTQTQRGPWGQLLLPGGARNGFTKEVMGTMALKERRQLEQNPPSIPL